MRTVRSIFSIQAIAVVILLVIGSILGAILVTEKTGSAQSIEWTYTSSNATWTGEYHTGNYVFQTVNNTTYVQEYTTASNSPDYSSALVSLDWLGNKKWAFNSTDYSGITVAKDGTIYCLENPVDNRHHANLTMIDSNGVIQL